jgi:predicted SprT family Zn-dependent metalloprotease
MFHYFTRKDNKPTKLSMDKIFYNEKVFVEILAHEMIHLFQYQFHEPLGHGPSFWLWRDNFKLKGLTLYKAA